MPSPSDVVWKDGKATLTRLRMGSKDGPAVLVVHSLISKPWILDLNAERSFLGALADAGFDTYLFDWGDFDAADAHSDLSHFAGLLMRAEEKVLASTGGSSLHLVGYCLGATLCLARTAARRHDHVRSLSLVAAPGDFGVPSGLQVLMSHRLLKPAFFLDGSSCVPAAAVRESFHWLRPQALKTVRWGLSQRRNSEFRATYDALARWVWEHRPLPGALFFDLVDLFRTNSLYEGHLEVAGEQARLSDIHVPVGAFVADRDHIVPSGSSHALAAVPGLDLTVFNCASGHVSMICGAGARNMMWPRLIEWIKTQDAPQQLKNER